MCDISIRTDEGVPGVAIVDVHGLLDVSSEAPGALAAQISGLLAEGRTRILVNLAQVTQIDSRGIGVLVFSGKKARDAGGELRVACRVPYVLDALKMVGLCRSMGCHTSETEALAAFVASPVQASDDDQA